MNIDKSIIDSAVNSALRRIKGDYQYCNLSDYGKLSREAEAEVTNGVWMKALKACDGFNFHQSAINAEAAVSACIHAGLAKNRITYTNNVYQIHMPNLEYCVFREITGFTAIPIPATYAQLRNREAIGFSREAFAEFMFAFDSLGPDIRTAIGTMLQMLRDYLLEKEKEAMIKKILKTAKWAAKH